MANNALQTQQLAKLLPDGMRCSNNRERLLCIVEILRLLTDKDHILSNAYIRAILQARFGEACAPAENTISADLRAIRNAGCLDLEVHITPAGAWCESRTLRPANVRLLLNAVQATRFLTEAENAALQNGVLGLVSRHQEENVDAEVYVAQRPRTHNQSVFDSCDIIAYAIYKKRKIEFEYIRSGFDGKPVTLTGDNGAAKRIETPIGIIYSRDNGYYVETYANPAWEKGWHITRCRVDRMANVRISSMPADSNAEVNKAQASLSRRVQEPFDMAGSISRIAFLRVRADYTDVMLDQFGNGLKYAWFDGNPDSITTTAVTCVRVAQSDAFYQWLTAAGSGIAITWPKCEMAAHSGPWKAMLRNIEYSEVFRDYQQLLIGYKNYLQCAASTYKWA